MVVLETLGLVLQLLELQTQVVVVGRQKVALAQVALELSSFAGLNHNKHPLPQQEALR